MERVLTFVRSSWGEMSSRPDFKVQSFYVKRRPGNPRGTLVYPLQPQATRSQQVQESASSEQSGAANLVGTLFSFNVELDTSSSEEEEEEEEEEQVLEAEL